MSVPQPVFVDMIAALSATGSVEGETPAADVIRFAELLEAVDPELTEPVPLPLEQLVPDEPVTAEEQTAAPPRSAAPSDSTATRVLETLPVLVSHPGTRKDGRLHERPTATEPVALPEQSTLAHTRGLASSVPRATAPASAAPAEPTEPVAADETRQGPATPARTPTAAATPEAPHTADPPAAHRSEPRELRSLVRTPEAPNAEALATPVEAARSARETGEVRGRVLPELPVRNESEILEQTRVLVERGGGRVRIELRPPSLGELGIRVVVHERAVAIEFIAERAAVSELLSQHLPALRQALESQGFDVDRLEVGTRATGGDLEREARADRESAGDRNGRQPPHDARPREQELTRSEDWTPLQHGGISLGTVDLRV